MPQDDLAKFYERAKQLSKVDPVRTKDYLLLCKEGVKLGKKYPQMRPDIGYYLTSVGAYLRIENMIDIAPDLEYPSNDKDWTSMGHLAEEALKELSEDFQSKD